MVKVALRIKDMNTLNHEIARFDADLKKLVADKIQKEMKTALDAIVTDSVANIVGLKCNEFMSNTNLGVPAICDADYATYISACKLIKLWVEPQTQVVYFRQQAGDLSDSFIFIILQSGKIMLYKNGAKYSVFNLNHAPSQSLITLIDYSLCIYYKDIGYIKNRSKLFKDDIAHYPQTRPAPYSGNGRRSGERSFNVIMSTTIIPLIEIFQDEKPYQLNADIIKTLRLEEDLNTRQAFMDERETNITALCDNYDQEKSVYIESMETKFTSITLAMDECKNAKQLMAKKVIELERNNKQLTKQLEEKTEMYDLLLDN